MEITTADLIAHARMLADEPSDYHEYARAIVELVCSVIGEHELLSDERDKAEILVLGKTIPEPKLPVVPENPTAVQILAARSYVNACRNAGVEPEFAQLVMSSMSATFGEEPGEPDAIETTVEFKNDWDSEDEDDFTPATAWMVLNNEISVALTRVSGGEDAGTLLVNIESLTEEKQPVMVENITSGEMVFHGEI